MSLRSRLMRFGFVCLLLTGLTWGCQASDSSERPEGASPQYVLTEPDGSAHPHELHPGDTVAIVLARDVGDNIGAVTLVLIRQGPEGKSRQLIQLDPSGKLMDEKQNYVLRDGDVLIIPAEHSNPGDYNRPDLPPSHSGQ